VRHYWRPGAALVLAAAAFAASVDIARARHIFGTSSHATHLATVDSAGPPTAADVGAHHVTAGTNPFTLASMRSYLASRHDSVDAAVLDLHTGRTFSWHPGRREQTASIVKADFLETLLHESPNQTLSEEDQEVARGMIEASDNDDATELYDAEGGPSAVAAYDKRAGMVNTTPNVAWGLTQTTAPDQLTLLTQLIRPDSLLKPTAQQYQLGLMSNIDAGENWGVSGGIPSGVEIALKNGWLPLDPTDGDGSSRPDWQVNSIGRIRGDGRWYLIAVLTTGNITEQYGIDTIKHVSGLVWNTLKRQQPGR
jgi:beta-lactamase class A